VVTELLGDCFPRPASLAGRLIQIRLATSSLEKSCQLVTPIRRKRESPIPVPEKRSTFHLRAQRNAFRRRDVGLQSSGEG
jgi:hypothetical protein